MAFKIIGIILLITSGVLAWIRSEELKKLSSLHRARPTTVAEINETIAAITSEIGQGNWRDYVQLWGEILCAEPLVSPLGEEPCVYYEMKVTREYEEKVTKQDSEGKTITTTERRSEVVSHNQRSVPFQLQDPTGAVVVHPEHADIATITSMDEFRPNVAGEPLIRMGSFSLTLGAGTFLAGSDRRTKGYRYREKLLPVGRKVLVVGQISDETGNPIITNPPNDGDKYLISLQTKEELSTQGKKMVKNTTMAAVITGPLGLILTIIGLL